MKFCMLDLETLATSVNAQILTIGALKFDPDVPLHVDDVLDFVDNHARAYYYSALTEQPNRDISYKTVAWWMKQGEAAKEHAFTTERSDFAEELIVEFKSWYKQDGEPVGCFAYPATFDHVILQSLYEQLGHRNPIHYTHMLDMRTIVKLTGIECPTLPDWLVQHNALHDCIRQVLWVQDIQRRTRIFDQVQQ